ncbi:Hsp20/alpha crystallin family protein [Streptomyces sp. NPDC048663]|uniref:Hsp20/alpha crystallin family protein n=1 Tax=Streptomyces sp. NPDC048663 TaxID=3155638 RepID=UPI00343ECFF2
MATLARRQRFPFPEIPEWFETFPSKMTMPAVRIEDYTKDDRYVLRAELPGMAPEDIDVVIGDGVLTVEAQRSEQDIDKSHSELRYGAMSRSVTLPSGADEDDVKADYTDGMLTVSVGLGVEKAEARHVEIQHGG